MTAVATPTEFRVQPVTTEQLEKAGFPTGVLDATLSVEECRLIMRAVANELEAGRYAGTDNILARSLLTGWGGKVREIRAGKNPPEGYTVQELIAGATTPRRGCGDPTCLACGSQAEVAAANTIDTTVDA